MAEAYSSTIAALGKLIAGLQKHPLPTGGVLAIDGTTYTTAELVQDIQSIIDPLNATVSARAAYLEAVHTSEEAVSEKKALIVGMTQTLQIVFGSSASTLSDFGLAPRKKRVTTTAVKVAAAEKAKATRKARGTKGSKQKAEIVGDVTGVTITPTTSSTATAPAASSAPLATIPSTAVVGGTGH